MENQSVPLEEEFPVEPTGIAESEIIRREIGAAEFGERIDFSNLPTGVDEVEDIVSFPSN